MVPQRSFFVFISLLCTLKWGLKSTAEPMHSSLHLSQVIKYMIIARINIWLLQERSPSIKDVLPGTLGVNFLSVTK